jgi:hypothetical protein
MNGAFAGSVRDVLAFPPSLGHGLKGIGSEGTGLCPGGDRSTDTAKKSRSVPASLAVDVGPQGREAPAMIDWRQGFSHA